MFQGLPVAQKHLGALAKQGIASGLLTSLLATSCLMPAFAQKTTISGDIRLTVSPVEVEKAIQLPGSEKLVDMTFRDIALADAFRALARRGGFNVGRPLSAPAPKLFLLNMQTQHLLPTPSTTLCSPKKCRRLAVGAVQRAAADNRLFGP